MLARSGRRLKPRIHYKVFVESENSSKRKIAVIPTHSGDMLYLDIATNELPLEIDNCRKNIAVR